MMNVLLLLVVLQVIAVLMRKTLIGRILLTGYRIFKGLLKMDYDLLKKFSKFINKKQKYYRTKQRQQTKKKEEKVSGMDNVINFDDFKDVAEFIRYKKSQKKGV